MHFVFNLRRRKNKEVIDGGRVKSEKSKNERRQAGFGDLKLPDVPCHGSFK